VAVRGRRGLVLVSLAIALGCSSGSGSTGAPPDGGSGYYGVDAYFDANGTGNVWSGNIWDDTGATIGP
jgi:hypothetical protein